MRKLVAGNWKMNGLGASLDELEALKAGPGRPACDVLVCPPATLIARAVWRGQGRLRPRRPGLQPRKRRAPSPATSARRC